MPPSLYIYVHCMSIHSLVITVLDLLACSSLVLILCSILPLDLGLHLGLPLDPANHSLFVSRRSLYPHFFNTLMLDLGVHSNLVLDLGLHPSLITYKWIDTWHRGQNSMCQSHLQMHLQHCHCSRCGPKVSQSLLWIL